MNTITPEQVRSFIEAEGLSVAKLAAKAGIGATTLRDNLSGKTPMSAVTTAKLTAVLPKPKAAKAPRAVKAGKPEALVKDGNLLISLPTAIIADSVRDAFDRGELKAIFTDDTVAINVLSAPKVVEAITVHMREIVKADRSANMYREGKLRLVRSAVLAVVPDAAPVKAPRTTSRDAKIARVEALNETLKAARAAKEAAKVTAAARRAS